LLTKLNRKFSRERISKREGRGTLVINLLTIKKIFLRVISGDSDVSVGIGSVTLGSENEKDCAAGSYKHAKLSGNEWATDLNLIKVGNDKINVGNEMIKAK